MKEILITFLKMEELCFNACNQLKNNNYITSALICALRNPRKTWPDLILKFEIYVGDLMVTLVNR